MTGFYNRYWEMRQGGPHDKGDDIFKCTDCGGETHPVMGHNGEPNPGNCFKHCKSRETQKRPVSVKQFFNQEHDRIFPNAPGAGM